MFDDFDTTVQCEEFFAEGLDFEATLEEFEAELEAEEE